MGSLEAAKPRLKGDMRTYIKLHYDLKGGDDGFLYCRVPGR